MSPLTRTVFLLFAMSAFAAGKEALDLEESVGESSVSALLAVDEADFAYAKNRPVSKVITMLKDMIMQLEKEGEEDQEVYESMGCWCETNDKAKTKSIADAESRINDLSAAIEELSAKSSQLNAEVGVLDKEVSKNTEALGSATALRDKQLAEFSAEEKDMTMSITSLKSAVVALSKQHEASSFLQESTSVRHMAVIQLVKDQLRRHAGLLTDKVSPQQHEQVLAMSLLQSGSRLSEPQSGEIFGVLKAMKESFETNLGQSQQEEMENAKAYGDLKIAKKDEIKAGSNLLNTKQDETAAADEKNAQAKKDLEETRLSLDADNEFLKTLKEKCQNVDHDYEERTKTRQLEIQATSKALKFLSSDEAHDLFSKTFNFVQLRSQSKRASAARKFLAKAARRLGDPRLALLSLKSRDDAFAEVRKTIQAMVEKLKLEKKDDAKLRDYCIEGFHANDLAKDEKTRDKSSQETKITDLEQLIKELTAAVTTLKEEIVSLGQELKKAGEDREKENAEFKTTVADQRATGKLLKTALDILKGFYDKAALVQIQASRQTATPGVIGMIQKIIDEAKTLEKEAVRDEKESQEAYEAFVTDTNDSIEAKTSDLDSKGAAKAKAEAAKVEMETELDGSVDALARLEATAADLHHECDYILENFEARNKARDAEVEALGQSIAIFSGASFSSMLQFTGVE